MSASGGPAWPVLFSLHSAARERHFHAELAGLGLPMPVATTARDHCIADGLCPAERVWWLRGHPGVATLADLPTNQLPEHEPHDHR
jgi:hypothetical protein